MAETRWARCLAPLGVALVLLGWFQVAQAGDKTKKTDKEKFQGEWMVQSAVLGGEALPEILIKKAKAIFKGDKVTLEFADDSHQGTAKLDESKKPKAIDLTLGDKTRLGIYQVEGEKLKVCLGGQDQARPAKFESPAGSETILVIFTRPKKEAKDKKEEKKPSANPGAVLFQGDKKDKGDKKGKTDKERFQGSWTLVSGVKDGKDAPQDVLEKFKITFTGDKLTMEVGAALDGSFKLDPKTKPKSIDLTIMDKEGKGIYKFEGDTLKICIMEPGNDGRPTEFKAPEGSKCIYMVLKRAKAACEEEQPVLFVPGDKKDKGDKKGKTDKDLFQGVWKIVEGEHNGTKLPQEVIDDLKFTFKGDKLSMEHKGMTKEGDFKLDQTTKPKSIDMNVDDKPGKGIYQIDGDTLKICVHIGDGERPKKFEAGTDSNNGMIVLKRVKATKKEEKKAGAVQFTPADFVCCCPDEGGKRDKAESGTKEPKGKSDKDLFQGSWKAIEAEHNGMKLPQEEVEALKVSFKGDKLNMEFKGTGNKGDFKLHPTTKPKSIDINIEGKPGGKGIYQIDGDTLKICFNAGDGERPKKFEAGADSNYGLVVLKREKATKKEEKKAGAVQFTPADFADCCADEGGDKGGKATDKDGFQGGWIVLSAEKSGEKIGDNMLEAIKIKFAGDKLVLDLFGTKSERAFKLDPTKNPKTIDVTHDDKTAKGIYELKGDSLKIALAEPGEARPKDFNGTAGTESALVILKRGKAALGEKKDKTTSKDGAKGVQANPAQGDQSPVAKKTDKEGLQGVWKPVSQEVSGKKMDPNDLAGMRLLITGDKVTVITPGISEPEAGTFKLDPTKKLRQLDITIKGLTMQAIYRLEGDKLTICACEPGQGTGRPAGFKTADTKNGLLVLERAKQERVENFAANAQVSMNNLKQIALAMHSYHDANNKLPGAAIYSKDGKPLLSWRVAILPYVEYQALYQEFKLDEPWDSEHNKKLIPKMPKLYTPYNNGEQRKSKTPYRVFTGKMTPFEGFGKDIRLQDITDGTSNTVLVVEGADQVTWTKPEDFPYDPKKPLPKLGGRPFIDRFHIALADGSVRAVTTEFDSMIFRAMITRNGGEAVDMGKLDKPKKSDKK